jgi:hypothetical protein
MGAAFPVTVCSLQRVSQMEHKDMFHAIYRLKIAISYRSKRHLPQETYEFVIFFRVAGSKYSQYLRIQPSAYVGLLYAGWWRGKGKREFCPLRERENILDSEASLSTWFCRMSLE